MPNWNGTLSQLKAQYQHGPLPKDSFHTLFDPIYTKQQTCEMLSLIGH